MGRGHGYVGLNIGLVKGKVRLGKDLVVVARQRGRRREPCVLHDGQRQRLFAHVGNASFITITFYKAFMNNLDSSTTAFEQLLKDTQLPSPGPDYYVARRALWLKSPDNTDTRQLPPSTSRHKLENLLSTPEAIYDKEIWEGGIHKVWKGLSGGATLKRRLPLNLVVGSLLLE